LRLGCSGSRPSICCSSNDGNRPIGTARRSSMSCPGAPMQAEAI
jgi:hypothetical protein